MKVVLVGGGMMAQAIQTEMPDAVILPHSEVDVTSSDSIVRAFREHQPDVAVYCAARHRLMECEKDPDGAFDVNARGAERLARLVPTVFLSTDYVWSSGGPHDEGMPGRQPRSVYGRSKLAGELATLGQDGIVVRISGVFDERFQSHKGPSFPEMVASSYSDLRLPSDQIFSPTYAKDAAERIALVVKGIGYGKQGFDRFVSNGGAIDKPAGVYHAANAGSVSWADLATYIRQRVGRPRMKVTAFEAKDPLRPTNSSLRSTRLMPLRSWMLAVDEWITARQRHLEQTREVSPLRSEA